MSLCAAWSHNCRGSADNALYLIHAYRSGARTVCGVIVQEIGEPITYDEIGCKRCRAAKLLRPPVKESMTVQKL